MQKKNYVQEILDIIHSGLPQAELAEKLSDYHENDLADALADLTAEERRKLYAILGVEQVAEIFSYLDDAEPYLKELPPEEAAQVVSHMAVSYTHLMGTTTTWMGATAGGRIRPSSSPWVMMMAPTRRVETPQLVWNG